MVHNLAAGHDVFTSNVFLVPGETPTLVDAGANFDVVGAIQDRDIDLQRLVLTHTHPDHVGNLETIRDALDPEVYAHDPSVTDSATELADGDRVEMGDHEYAVIHTPGHAPDHVCLYAETPGICFAGDLVFANGGFGRTDLPGGDRATLRESIDRLREATAGTLTELHCGHGPSVTQHPHDHIELAARMAGRQGP